MSNVVDQGALQGSETGGASVSVGVLAVSVAAVGIVSTSSGGGSVAISAGDAVVVSVDVTTVRITSYGGLEVQVGVVGGEGHP